MKILVTGSAGFIGFYLAEKLISLGHSVIGMDNINDYYDINLKYARLNHSGIKRERIEYGKKIPSASLPGADFGPANSSQEDWSSYAFIKLDLTDRENLFALFAKEKFDCV